MPYLVLIVILMTVTLSAFAQLILKVGVTRPSMLNALKIGGLDAFQAAALSPFIWLGVLGYVICFAMWLWVLAKAELSLAYPFVGLSFLVTMALGALFLDESVTPIRILGTVLIACGCILVGRSA